jgi:hypothetical protein
MYLSIHFVNVKTKYPPVTELGIIILKKFLIFAIKEYSYRMTETSTSILILLVSKLLKFRILGKKLFQV